MVKVAMIRHGEPDYSFFNPPRYVGFGKEVGPLSSKGIEQAKAVANDPRLNGANKIVVSPFTRALHTAIIINKKLNLDIEIQPGLHEWLPDDPYLFTCNEDYAQPNVDFMKYNGEKHPLGTYNYETLQEVFDRAYESLLPYVSYDKIIVVCHGVLMKAFEFREKTIDYCGIITFDFDESRVLSDNEKGGVNNG